MFQILKVTFSPEATQALENPTTSETGTRVPDPAFRQERPWPNKSGSAGAVKQDVQSWIVPNAVP